MKKWIGVLVLVLVVVVAVLVTMAETHRQGVHEVGQTTSWVTSREHPKSETVFEGKGPAHCGWQDMTFLSWNSPSFVRSFVRDVNGKLAAYTLVPFEAQATLPAGATFTGWYDGQRQLWDDSDVPASIYIVSPDGVERWPAIGICI